jgi:putative MFS transporter
METLFSRTVTARIDRLPMTRTMWTLIVWISIGAFFEAYDLFQMTYLPAGLMKDGIFHAGTKGFAGLSDQGMFGAATFLGLFVGELFLARLADRWGRRTIFTWALLLYTFASIGMCLQSTAAGVHFFRFLASCGVGAELITISTFLVEMSPKAARGKVMAICFAIGYLAMPVLAFLSWQLIPLSPFGVSGWRWIIIAGGSGAVVVWYLQAKIPESPHWLAENGKANEADAILRTLEASVAKDLGQPLPPLEEPQAAASIPTQGASIWGQRYRSRVIALIFFNIFLSIGFFGFSQWLPSLLSSQGMSITKSLFYSFVIAFAYPVSPFLARTLADRFERKWLICASALGAALFGTGFAMSSAPWMAIMFGIMVTFCNTTLASNATAYQAEVFPTAIRGRAMGFVHSFGRASGIFNSLLVAVLLEGFGAVAVFALIITSMVIVVLSIGLFCPQTNNRSLQEIDDEAVLPKAAMQAEAIRAS